MNNNQYVIVLTGAAGTGKTSAQDYLQQKYGIPRVITHTTRPPRPGEKNGVEYYFETDASFAKLHLLEKVEYAGHQYGSSLEAIHRALQQNNIVSIVLDTKGAITYKKELGKHAIVFFMQVDNQNELRQRMLKRGDKPAAVEHRITSKEDIRDLVLPKQLVGKAEIITNENWQQTEIQLDNIIKKLMDN